MTAMLTREQISNRIWVFVLLLIALGLPGFALAAETVAGDHTRLNLTAHWVGFTAIAIFVVAYALVMLEEVTHLRKSKPVILAAGLIWAIIGYHYAQNGMPHAAEKAVRHNILEFAELMLFLLVAMTYINAMEERNVFAALRTWLVRQGYSFRTLFWITGVLSFIISPVADNLTTALLMCAVVMAVGKDRPAFVAIAAVNIVVAANAGGAFSPFGDITTLMVWQKGIVQFTEFFAIFIPSVINWIIPAVIMSFAVPQEQPTSDGAVVPVKTGGLVVIVLFLLTIMTAVSFHNFLHLPPMLGMMTGLAYLQFFGYFLRRHENAILHRAETANDPGKVGDVLPFEVFRQVARSEWDTLLFFFGVVLAVGGLGFIGYLSMVSQFMYVDLGPTTANIIVGILSAIVDNIPVMFAVLTMNPEMSHNQWLLVTLTAGVGGSLLSVGSAAGVALMGQARGIYTFFAHLKWTWAIGLGYVASIIAHLMINGY